MRNLNQIEAQSITGGADLGLNLGALGSLFLDAALPALGALAAAVNNILLGLFGTLSGLGNL